MKVRNTLLTITIAMLLACSTLLLSSCGEKKSDKKDARLEITGVVTQVIGEFDIFGLTTNCWVSGSQGTPIMNGDRIKVGPASTVSILLASGARFTAHASSHFQVIAAGMEKSRIALTLGEIWLCADGMESATEVFSSTVKVSPNEDYTPDNSLSVLVEPGGHTMVDVYKGGAILENKSGIVRGKSPGRYEASNGLSPMIVDAEYNRAGAPDENNSRFAVMQIEPFFSDEDKRDEIEEEALAQIEAGSQEPWSYAALAQVRVDRGEYDQAYEILDLVLEIDPYYEPALLARGKIELLNSKWREAESTFASAKRSAVNPVEALFGLAQSYLGLGDLASAGKWYKEMLNAEPEETRALTGLGIVNLLQLRLDEASTDFNQALEVESEYIPANIGLAMVELLEGDGIQAGRHLRIVLDKDPKFYEAWTLLGVLRIIQGNNSAAEAAFRRLEGSDDGWYMSVGYQNHGAVDWISGKAELALEKWIKSLDLKKERYPVKVNIGSADLSLGMFADAEEIFTRLSSLDPLDWYPHSLMGVTFFLAGSYDGAAGEAAYAVEYNGLDWPSKLIHGMSVIESGGEKAGNGEVRRGRADTGDWEPAALDHCLLGFSYEQEKDYPQALAEYRTAQELFPSQGYYYYRAGVVLALQGEEDEALEEFRLAVQSNEPYPKASIEIARIRAENGDLEKAVQEIESAVGRDKDNLDLRKAASEFLVGQKRYDDAARQLKQAVEIEGLEPVVLAELLILEGRVMDRKKNYREASLLYEEALEHDSSRGDAWYYLAVDLEKSRKAEQAIQAYQQAYLLCAQNPEWAELQQKAAEKLAKPQ